MSLDHTLDALRRFSGDMSRFNQLLAGMERELAARHEALDGLWEDESRRAYEAAFAEYQARLASYALRDAPRFDAFLAQKCQQLERYLRGGR